MIKLEYENPERKLFPGLPEFRQKLSSIEAAANLPGSPIQAEIEKTTPHEREMGDLLTIILILKVITAGAAALASLINLIIKVRDLYLAYLSERFPRQGSSGQADRLVLKMGGTELELPATDDEIRAFVIRYYPPPRTDTQPLK